MPESARSYSCPSCGAAVAEQARSCVYCTAPIATVRCASCFHMNVPEALHCSGCGRETGLEPVGEASTHPCPHCTAALQAFPQTRGTVLDCATCGGQFVEHAALRDLVDRCDLPLPVQKPADRAAAPVSAVRYIPCPMCRSFMNRKNFGGASGVIVDVCRAHGTWFDLGELPRVLSFVERGGLERERQRKAEDAAAERRSRVAASIAEPHLSIAGDGDRGSAVGGFLIDLLLR